MRGTALSKFNRPPSLATYGHWRLYKFPFDFYYNAVFQAYETTIHSGLMCLNSHPARLEINPVDGKVSLEQIERIKTMESIRYKINLFLKEKFWEHYNTSAKIDFELPELKEVEQLFYFVKPASIILPATHEEPISLFFSTWDEEHGQFVNYYDENDIRFL